MMTSRTWKSLRQLAVFLGLVAAVTAIVVAAMAVAWAAPSAKPDRTAAGLAMMAGGVQAAIGDAAY